MIVTQHLHAGGIAIQHGAGERPATFEIYAGMGRCLSSIGLERAQKAEEVRPWHVDDIGECRHAGRQATVEQIDEFFIRTQGYTLEDRGRKFPASTVRPVARGAALLKDVLALSLGRPCRERNPRPLPLDIRLTNDRCQQTKGQGPKNTPHPIPHSFKVTVFRGHMTNVNLSF
jgi:hypothetical protein